MGTYCDDVVVGYGWFGDDWEAEGSDQMSMRNWFKCCSNRKRTALSVPVMVAIIVPIFLASTKKTPLEKAYKICEDCGLDKTSVDMLIENYHGSGLNPTDAIQLLKDTSETPESFELCKSCADAVIEACQSP